MPLIKSWMPFESWEKLVLHFYVEDHSALLQSPIQPKVVILHHNCIAYIQADHETYFYLSLIFFVWIHAGGSIHLETWLNMTVISDLKKNEMFSYLNLNEVLLTRGVFEICFILFVFLLIIALNVAFDFACSLKLTDMAVNCESIYIFFTSGKVCTTEAKIASFLSQIRHEVNSLWLELSISAPMVIAKFTSKKLFALLF